MYKYVETIKTKRDFDDFVKMLIFDVRNNPQEWENDTLERFFEGLYRYSNDVGDEISPNWKQFAQFFLAAKIYE